MRTRSGPPPSAAAGGGPAICIRPRNLASLGIYTGTITQLTAGHFPSDIGLCGYSRFSADEGLWIKDHLSGALALTPSMWPKSTLRILRPGAATAFVPGGIAFAWAGAQLETKAAGVLSGLFDECLKTLGQLRGTILGLIEP